MKKLINDIKTVSSFHDDLNSDNCEELIIEPLFNVRDKSSFQYKIGSTKLCIAPTATPWVLKIPFKGIVDEDDGEFTNFVSAGINPWTVGWDYCALEVEIYECAKRLQIEPFFAKIALVDDEVYPLYIQRRAIPLPVYHSDTDSFQQQRAEQICSTMNISNFDYYWLTDFINTYGKTNLKLLNKFINLQSINDLRRPNLGYINDKPVIIDYAGYREW